ncbi:MAG: hypothetical protein M3A44_12470 [Gammaproteobacteria bacterium]
MNWTVTAPQFDVESFQGISPEEILYEFDGPRIFTARSVMGELLFYLADEQDGLCRYIVAPTNTSIIDLMKSGVRSVRDALNQPWVWFLDTQYDGNPVAAWKGTLADAPVDTLPRPGVMLWPHLEPVFVLRAIGDGLGEGTVPASVIRQVVDGATTALKKIAGRVFQAARAQGRKANVIRQFYDLPMQGVAYNSFEIAFRLPDRKQLNLGAGEAPEELGSEFDEIGKLLEQALSWAIDAKPEEDNEPLDIDLLEALEKLVPPQTGIVKSVELRGRIFRAGHARYQLTRDTSKRVRRALGKARVSQERITKVTGLVRELDKDDLSFTLRETDDSKDHVCRFPQEFFDDVLEVFNTDQCVTISGRENIKNGEIDVSLVSREPSATESSSSAA